MLRPISDNQPLSAKVKGMRFVEIQKDGWLFATKVFTNNNNSIIIIFLIHFQF